MPDTVPSLRSMRICGRSYIAYVLTPEVPVFDFLSNLDIWTRRSVGFFAGKPVVLDLSALVLSKNAVPTSSPSCKRAASVSWGSKASARPI